MARRWTNWARQEACAPAVLERPEYEAQAADAALFLD